MSNVKRMDDHLLAKAIMAIYRLNDLLEDIYKISENPNEIGDELEETCKALDAAVERLKTIRERKKNEYPK